MFLRIIFFFIGIIFTVIGMISTILYLNLLSIGYSFLEYVNFIISRLECICLFLGLIIIAFSIFVRRKK